MRRALIFATVGMLLLSGVAVGEEGQTTVRVFQLRHTSVREASLALQPLLSPHGSLTVQPRAARITVQDRPEIIARIVEAVASLDRPRRGYRIRVDLLSYWEERKVWVSDGRILSEAQSQEFKILVGRKPRPDAQRQALAFLEAHGKEA